MLQLWLLRQLFDYREKVLWLREYELGLQQKVQPRKDLVETYISLKEIGDFPQYYWLKNVLPPNQGAAQGWVRSQLCIRRRGWCAGVGIFSNGVSRSLVLMTCKPLSTMTAFNTFSALCWDRKQAVQLMSIIIIAFPIRQLSFIIRGCAVSMRIVAIGDSVT